MPILNFDKIIKMKIGKKISKLRKEHGKTQKELAELLNVTDKAVSRWESGLGNPEIELIPKIAKVFDVSTDYLLGNLNNQPDSSKTKEKIIKDKNKRNIVLLSVAVGICLIAFIVFLSLFLVGIIKYNIAYADAAKQAPVGVFFDMSEGNIKTIEFAAQQGKTLTLEDADFIQWKTALLGLYDQYGNIFIYKMGSKILLDKSFYYYLIPIVLSICGFIPSFIFQIKNIKSIKSL